MLTSKVQRERGRGKEGVTERKRERYRDRERGTERKREVQR